MRGSTWRAALGYGGTTYRMTIINNTVSRKALHLQSRFDSSSCFFGEAILPGPRATWWASITALMLALPQRPPKRGVINEVLSGFIPWVALNLCHYLLPCQYWQWWTRGRQLTTPRFINQKEGRAEIKGRWLSCWSFMHVSAIFLLQVWMVKKWWTPFVSNKGSNDTQNRARHNEACRGNHSLASSW